MRINTSKTAALENLEGREVQKMKSRPILYIVRPMSNPPVVGWFKEARLHMDKVISSLAAHQSQDVYRETGTRDARSTCRAGSEVPERA